MRGCVCVCLYYDVNIGEFGLSCCFVVYYLLIHLFGLCLHVYGEYSYVFDIRLFVMKHRC